MRLILISLFFILTNLGLVQAGHSLQVKHLPLEMTFSEYQSLYANLSQTKSMAGITLEPEVQASINAGEKMSEWIKLINSNRSGDTAIRLTSKGTQRGIPIDKPSKYGPTTISKKLASLKLEMPKEMSVIIFGDKDIQKTPIVDDLEFILWCKKVSGNYQSAVRWTGMKRWLSHYEKRKAQDVRGYFYLNGLADLDEVLENFSNLDQKLAKKVSDSLVGLCLNSGEKQKSCNRKLKSFMSKNKLVEFKNRYWSAAIKNWDSFYKITNPRKDVVWSKKAPGVMEVVFKDPKNREISNWLKDNVEDEFRLVNKNWSLEMRYIPGKFGTAHLEFKKNVTPHVSGGNKIVMDANTELEEYGVKWTIRHEFGHILRIPDCYHEFYDRDLNLMINYQLDVTDLMCSRAGSMNERIFNELKRHYLK